MRKVAMLLLRLARVSLTFYSLLNAPALAQTTTPGAGGVPIAPGAAVTGYEPGGIGSGSILMVPRPDLLPSEPVVR